LIVLYEITNYRPCWFYLLKPPIKLKIAPGHASNLTLGKLEVIRRSKTVNDFLSFVVKHRDTPLVLGFSCKAFTAGQQVRVSDFTWTVVINESKKLRFIEVYRAAVRGVIPEQLKLTDEETDLFNLLSGGRSL